MRARWKTQDHGMAFVAAVAGLMLVAAQAWAAPTRAPGVVPAASAAHAGGLALPQPPDLGPSPTRALCAWRGDPHVFADAAGRPVKLIGDYPWGTFSDGSAYDYDALFDNLRRHGLNFVRVYVFWGLAKFPVKDGGGRRCVIPYLRTGPGLAHDGKPRYDLTKFNPAFFKRLAAVCEAARKRGIFLQLTIFDAWMIKHHDLWLLNAFQRDNNVNGVDGDPAHTGVGTDGKRGFCSMGNPGVLAAQKLLVGQIIDAVNQYPNILFEIANENYYSAAWEKAMCEYIHQYERGKPRQHLVMPMDVPHHDYGGIKTFKLNNLHRALLKARAIDQPLIWDTDGAGSPDDDTIRRAAWTVFASGGNIDYLDPSLQPGIEFDGSPLGEKRASMRRQLSYLSAFARRTAFWSLKPVPDPTGGDRAFVAASTGQLVAYLPDGGQASLDLRGMKGTLTGRWYNPRTGRWGAVFTAAAGGSWEAKAPGQGDWAVLLMRGE